MLAFDAIPILCGFAASAAYPDGAIGRKSVV
jgi:hypothetical protein